MESLTKMKQSREVIEKMVQKFFPSENMKDYMELTEGFFNVAYKIELEHGKSVILKIAPDRNMRIMASEKDIMHSEVEAMQTVSRYDDIKSPRVLGADFSCTVCNAPYFFMEELEGHSLNSIKDTFSEEQIRKFYTETGRMMSKINAITCPCFGYPAQKEYQDMTWFPVFRKMLQGIVSDAQKGNVDLRISIEGLWKHLESDRKIFDEVTEPRLVHWDGWDGNIFVNGERVTGLIDWERCMWADPLMEEGFRTYHEDNSAFMKGYGLETLSPNQKRRALWYDIYLLMLGSCECEYRHYETMDMYNWANTLLQKQVSLL